MHDVGLKPAQQPAQRQYAAQIVRADFAPQRQPMERRALRGGAGKHRVIETLAERRDQMDFRIRPGAQPRDQVGQMHGDATAGRLDDQRDAQRRRGGCGEPVRVRRMMARRAFGERRGEIEIAHADLRSRRCNAARRRARCVQRVSQV